MELWLWALIGIMAAVIAALLVKIYFLHKAAGEIGVAFADRITTETNTLIGISTGDRYLRKLANDINFWLRRFHAERRRFAQGDMELKNAVANISHDLRTPLTAICGYLDLLEKEEKSERVQQYFTVIRNRADLLTQLTEELFLYSMILSDENESLKEPVAIGSVLEESLAAFYLAFTERGIVPAIQIPEQKIIRNVERSALTRIFSNLLNNALKYSGGDLEIRLSQAGEIVFTNTAPGLNEVQVGKLFDRFYTVEAARNSTGLGLAIARTLAERMGGTVTARYENGRLSICVAFPEQGERIS